MCTTNNIKNINGIDYPVFNLLGSNIGRPVERLHQFIKENSNHQIKTVGQFSVGDKIDFISGHNDDMIYITKIMGFKNEKQVFVYWDCYWFPVDIKKLMPHNLV